MEKNKRKGEFEVETDWEGVFVDDDEEVLLRDYKEPEELDVREYCKRELKVDIGTSNKNVLLPFANDVSYSHLKSVLPLNKPAYN
jgi:hypothetical protein